MAVDMLDTSAELPSADVLRQSHFFSGVSHRILQLGQRPDDGASAAAVPSSSRRKAQKQKVVGSSGGARTGPQGKRGRGVTVQDLVMAGLLQPGKGKVSVQYKGQGYVANLSKEGYIEFRGQRYQSATSFSMFCKRLQTPNKQGDDGWKSVLYEGQPLDVFRHKYQERYGDEPFLLAAVAAQQMADDEAQAEAAATVAGIGEGQREEEGNAEEPAGAEAMELADGEQAATGDEESDQWVHCDRCSTWRIVPDEQWEGVQSDTRKRWYCEYAAWDVSKTTPHTKPCKKK